MSFRVIVGRRPLPVGLPTLAQVQALAAQAQSAAQAAAAEAVAAAQPALDAAVTQSAQARDAAMDARSLATEAADRAEATAASGRITSRDAAQLLDILLPISRITVVHDGEALDYVRLPAGWDATYAPLTTFGGQKWMASGVPTLRHFGGVGDGNAADFTGTDNYNALNSLLKFVETNNARVKAAHINSGVFLVTKDPALSTAMRLHAFDITITGEGEGVSVLLYRNSLVDATSRPFLFSNQPHGRVELRDFAVVSDWTLGANLGDLGHIFSLESFVGDFYANRIRIEGSCSMNIVVTGGNVVEVMDCTFIRSQRDGVHVSRNRKNRVDNCRFIDVCDDSISASYRLDSHLDTEAIFTNNFIYKSQGIHVGGARNIIVEGNIILMAPMRGIYVGYTNTPTYPDRGPIARWSISVRNNQVQDVFARSRFGGSGTGTGYIMVGDRGSVSGVRGFNQPVVSTDGTHYVWGPDGAGGVVDPLDYAYEARNLVGNMNVIVEGNSCVRTLKPAASFDAYGFGPLYVQDVGRYTGDIIEADFLNEHYLIGGTFRSLIVADNMSRRANQPYRLEGPGQTAISDFEGAVVRGNHAADFDAASAFRVDMTGVVEFEGNHVDGDPIHRSPARAADGGWTDATAKVAYEVVSGRAIIRGGTVRNVSAVISGSAEVVAPLTIHADAVALGDNAANLGVRVIPAGYPFTYARTISNPTLATFGQVLGVTKAYASQQPTEGDYLAGQVVTRPHPALTAEGMVTGWLRLTTGSGHAANVDWQPIYAGEKAGNRLSGGDGGPLRFGYLTDTHNRDAPPEGIRYFADAPAKTTDAVAAFRARDVDFIFHGGDVIQGYGTAAEDVADLEEIVGIIRTAGVPDYYVCGNHDLPRMTFSQFVAATDIPAQGYYHFDHKGVRFIALDTSYSADDDASHYNADGYATANKYVPPGERAWLSARLAEWNGRFVLFSHNPLSAQTAGNTYTSNADAVHAILAPYAARILGVISGHSHTNLETIRDGVRYYEMEAATDNAYPANAYAVITVDDAGLSIEGFGGQTSWQIPAITSPATVKGVEGYPLRHALASSQPATWRISGGADAGDFVIGGTSTLQFIGLNAPVDDKASYAVEVEARKGTQARTQAVTVQVIPVPTFDPDLEVLLAKSATAPSITHKIAYNDLMGSLKSSGAWDKLVGFKLLATHARDMALVDWKNAAFDMTDIPAIEWVPSRGFRGNQTNSFAIAFNPRTPGTALYAQDSAAMGVMMEQFAGISRAVFGNTNTRVGYSANGTAGFAAHNTAADTPNFGGNHAAWRRSSATGYDRFRDGAFVDTITTPSALPTSTNFTLLGAAGGFTQGLVNAAYWGSGTLTDGEMQAIDAAMRDYMSAIGTAL